MTHNYKFSHYASQKSNYSLGTIESGITKRNKTYNDEISGISRTRKLKITYQTEV